jgi:hypothetical protein
VSDSSFSLPSAGGSPARRGPFVPLILLVVAFLVWTVFQTFELVRERSVLAQTRSLQAASITQAQKIRAATDSLASKTQKLADGGNPDAQLVVSQLKQRGITVNPYASTPPPP